MITLADVYWDCVMEESILERSEIESVPWEIIVKIIRHLFLKQQLPQQKLEGKAAIYCNALAKSEPKPRSNNGVVCCFF